MPTRQGSIKLFKLFGIDVYAHWLWFVILIARMVSHDPSYGSMSRFVVIYLSLFLIVLVHEFGHALACRQVGGHANQIVLWLFGGVAYVSPPQRPGAMLWSIAAGPLVNVLLFLILTVLWVTGSSLGWPDSLPGFYFYIRDMWYINTGLLVFNLMPIYPLDGGQILRSLLWFIFGRARSLLIATIIGFIGVAALLGLAGLLFLFSDDKQPAVWLGAMDVFILINCWGGLMQARAMAKLAQAARREGFACPACKTPPPQGPFWICGKCRKPFDTFLTRAICPNCGVQYGVTYCPECGSLRPLSEWGSFLNAPPKL